MQTTATIREPKFLLYYIIDFTDINKSFKVNYLTAVLLSYVNTLVHKIFNFINKVHKITTQ